MLMFYFLARDSDWVNILAKTITHIAHLSEGICLGYTVGDSQFAVGTFNKDFYSHRYFFSRLINGGLAGFVAVASGATRYEPWAAFVVGMIAALVYKAYSVLFAKVGGGLVMV